MTVEPVQREAPPLRGRVLMSQDWRDLTYLHWAVSPERVAAFMPPGVRPDVYDGQTYVGLVPFRMVDAGFGRGRPVPFFGTFLETNVRLYSVDSSGRRGIVFLSLDADRLAVVAGARASLSLPYRYASMSHLVRTSPEGVEHTYTARLKRPHRPATSRIRIRVGEPREATELDHFLSARWRLHTGLVGRTIEVPNQHEPWPLHDAEVLELEDGLRASVGLPELAGRAPDHVAFSPGVHTEFGLPRRVGGPRQP